VKGVNRVVYDVTSSRLARLNGSDLGYHHLRNQNCDTMKKARAWLDKHSVDYAFHDYKSAGIERDRLERWANKVGWETLLNRAGTTFKKLPDKDKAGLSEAKAIALMLKQPSMIKRPVLDAGGGKLLVGFKPEQYMAALG
jgi:arsenate reductase